MAKIQKKDQDSSSKSGAKGKAPKRPIKHSRPKAAQNKFESDISLMGFKSKLHFSSINQSNPPPTLFFNYYENNHGSISINHISEFSIEAKNNPIEKNVGQFGLFALCHASSFPNKIVDAKIIFNRNSSYTPERVSGAYIPALTYDGYLENTVAFHSELGENNIDIFRDLQLFTFLKETHEGLNKLDSTCPLVENISGTFNPPQISLFIQFTITDKEGRSLSNELKLKFRFLG